MVGQYHKLWTARVLDSDMEKMIDIANRLRLGHYRSLYHYSWSVFHFVIFIIILQIVFIGKSATISW